MIESKLHYTEALVRRAVFAFWWRDDRVAAFACDRVPAGLLRIRTVEWPPFVVGRSLRHISHCGIGNHDLSLCRPPTEFTFAIPADA